MCSRATQSFHDDGLPRAVSDASQVALSFLSSGTGCLESRPRPALEFAEKGPAKARGVSSAAVLRPVKRRKSRRFGEQQPDEGEQGDSFMMREFVKVGIRGQREGCFFNH